VEGTVTDVNKGGLTLDVKGIRSFLPLSRIDRGRVQEPESYLGERLRCEVLSVDRDSRNVVLDRRAILEREAEVIRERVLATLSEGQVLRGEIRRLTDHGAFVDLGGVDGLLPRSRIHAHSRSGDLEEPLKEGQELQVQIVSVDLERGRVSLDFKYVESDLWGQLIEHYSAGDEVTGWVSARNDEGVVISLEEGIEGLLPESTLHRLPEPPRPGTILKAVVASIDREARRLVLSPRRE
jgi:ribosomal protein S1